MRRNLVFAQLAVFGVISISIIAYTVFGVVGYSPTADPIRVTVQLRTAGGIFSGAEVAYRGVDVGRVTSVALHRDGVTVGLSIDEGTRVPADTVAHIYDLSVVGEQYVDLVPRRTDGPLLASGDVIPATRTTTPVRTPTVLLDIEQLVRTINPADVRTVSSELSDAFAGSTAALRRILADGGTLVDELSRSRAATLRLLRNGGIVLDTAARHARDFDAFAASLEALTSTLKSSTPALTKLVDDGASTTRVVDQLITDNGSAAAVLMGNLATLGGIQVATVPGLRALLVAVPEFGDLLPRVVRNGAIQAAALFNYDQPTCPTGVPLTSPISHQRTPLSTARCPDAGSLPRGAANAPGPASGASTSTAGERVLTRPAVVGTYDPRGGLIVTPGGTAVRLGADGGQDQVFGSRSWETLLLPAGAQEEP